MDALHLGGAGGTRACCCKAKSWFTGYNSNVEGHDKIRCMICSGGAPRYRQRLAEVAETGYEGFRFS